MHEKLRNDRSIFQKSKWKVNRNKEDVESA